MSRKPRSRSSPARGEAPPPTSIKGFAADAPAATSKGASQVVDVHQRQLASTAVERPVPRGGLSGHVGVNVGDGVRAGGACLSSMAAAMSTPVTSAPAGPDNGSSALAAGDVQHPPASDGRQRAGVRCDQQRRRRRSAARTSWRTRRTAPAVVSLGHATGRSADRDLTGSGYRGSTATRRPASPPQPKVSSRSRRTRCCFQPGP